MVDLVDKRAVESDERQGLELRRAALLPSFFAFWSTFTLCCFRHPQALLGVLRQP